MNINGIIGKVKEVVDNHNLASTGMYARWIWQNDNNTRQMGINPYGCADAANILYTIGNFESDNKKRQKWIDTLRSFQNPQTGLFVEETHNDFHTTAHCVAALELFDSKPNYPLENFKKYATQNGLYELLDSLDWSCPWQESHKGAGVYAAMVLTDSVGPEWKKWYFDYLWEIQDSEIGFWKKDSPKEPPMFHHMTAGFHYLFNYEYERKMLRYPERIIDTCIDLYIQNKMNDMTGSQQDKIFGKNIDFRELDWVYTINRASRQTDYRYKECKILLEKFACEYIEFLNSIDINTHDRFNDLHMLFGCVCALAELQQALPGKIESDKPLKLVLDRRPFV